MKTTINKALILLLMGFILIKAPVYADEVDLDYPHCSTYDIACLSCHYMFEDLYTLGWPDWVTHEPTDIDDTPYNNLCRSCHNDVRAPYVKTHSSLTTSDGYGDWSIECRTCHDPHHQWQLWAHGTESYCDTGTSTSITFNTLTESGAGWTQNQYQGFTLIPNLDELSYNNIIIANTGDTFTIDGYMNKREQDFDLVYFSTFPWSTGGDADWTTQNTTWHSPEYAAEAPTSLEDPDPNDPNSLDQMSYLQVRLKITWAGNISFWYKVSSQPGDDYLRFLIDGEEQDRWSGEIDWTQKSYSVSADWHTFRWEYTKRSGGSVGSDTAWIDDITFPTKVTVEGGDTFAIIYGKLIRDEISTPNSGDQIVKFFNPTGDNSFADGDSTFDGVCEVCHTQTTHFRNDASGSDQLHENVGGGQEGANCINCHSHDNGFGHGGGGGASCGGVGCHGETGSHATHTQSNTKGPATVMACGDCHDTNNYPYFGALGAAESLAATDVCDDCHSEGGVYNGINDSGDSIGAKDNWDEVYNTAGDALLAGKEKWCIGCHDGGTSVIDDANAPSTDLYYTGGHGRAGAAKECLDCHDTTKTHIDGEARTYAFNSAYYGPTQSGVAYAAGYRLRYVEGNVPLMIPANYNLTFGYDAALMRDTAFRLCFASGCHADDFNKIFDDTPGDGISSNFKASLPNPPRNYSYAWGSGADVNEHIAHIMNYIGPFCDSDWDMVTIGPGGSDGRDTTTACFACHNVHGSSGTMGSTNEPMIRDGGLAGRTGYGFSYVVEDIGSGGYPLVTSTGATQANSVGAIFRNNTANMCGGSMCHADPAPPAASSYDATGSSWGTYIEYYRPYYDY